MTTVGCAVQSDKSNNEFQVRRAPSVTYPTASGITWNLGSPNYIIWYGFTSANVKIELLKGWALDRVITNWTPNDGSFWWSVPSDLPNAANYRVRINAISDTGQWDESDADFILTRRPKVTYPSVPGITWQYDHSVQIQWQNFLGANVRIVLLKGGAFHRLISGNTPNDGSFWWSVPNDLPSGDDYRIKINSTNHFGLVDRSNNDFEISP